MDIKRARQYAILSFVAALFMLLVSFLFSITLSYQSHRDGNGRGLNILSQFMSSPMKGVNLSIATPFDKGDNYYDNDLDRALIKEVLVRYYLEMRFTFIPDMPEMLRRWGWGGPVSRLSTSAVHAKVVGGDLEDKIRKRKGEVQTVEIMSLDCKTDRSQCSAVVRVDILSEDGSLRSSMSDVILTLRYANRYKSFRKPINPYGLYINGVSIAERKNN